MNGPADPRGHAGDPDERDGLSEREPGGPSVGGPYQDGPAADGAESPSDPGEPRGPADPGALENPADLDDVGDLGELLRLPIEPMPIPEGAFTQIRRRAVRRRRKRALVGASACFAVLGVSLYLVGVPATRGPGEVVTPPASATQAAPTPSPVTTGPTPSASPSAAPTQSPSPTATPSASTVTPQASGSPTPGPTATGSGTGGGTAPLCTAAQLGAALGSGNAGAGQIYTYLVVTNRSSTTCQVAGYPGLSMLDAHGAEIGAPAIRESLAYIPVVLAPGASASDTVHTVNRQTNNPSECLPTSTSLRMYPPGSRVSLTFAGQVTDCDNTFTITPFGPGVTGNPPG